MTEVTLRKANQLEKQALEAATKVRLATQLKISVYEKQPLEKLIDAARNKVRKSLAEAIALTEAAYQIRALASTKLHEIGIGRLLLEKALVEAKERHLNAYLASDSFESEDNLSLEVLGEKIKTMRTRLEAATRGYGLDESLAINVLSEHDKTEFDDQLIQLKNRKTAIVDELMQKNWNGTITLPSSVVEILRRHKITV
jgi:hypothetical protein